MRQPYWDRRYSNGWDLPFHGMTQSSSAEMQLEERGLERVFDVLLKPEYRVLDAGCGYGRLAPMICERVQEYVGVDFAEQAIEEARAHAPANARYVLGDIAALDLPDAHFDVAVLCGVSSSLGPRGAVVLANLRALIKRDGFVLVLDITSTSAGVMIRKDGTECAL
jgi:SAM-dependent methyltransferase